MTASRAVDVHAHAMPLAVLTWLAGRGLADLTELRHGVVRLDERISGLPSRTPLPCPAEQFDVPARLARMDREGVRRQALSLPPFLTCSTARDARLVREVVTVGNDALADLAAEAPDRLLTLATAPVGTEFAADEVERCLRDLGTAGISSGTQGLGRELDDPVNEPLWEVLAARRVFSLLHPSGNPAGRRLADYWLPQLVGYPTETALAGSRLALGGVLERHDLALCLAHGGGCLPALRGRLTLGWRRKPQAAVRTGQSPADSLAGLYYDTAVFDTALLRHLVDQVGADHVLLGTDSPFDLADTRPLDTVASLGLDAATARLITHQNAERLLRTAEHDGRTRPPRPHRRTLPMPTTRAAFPQHPGSPAREAFDLVQGHVLCSVLASLDQTGVLPRLAEKGLRVAEAGENQFLAEGTFTYLSQRGVVRADGETYRLTELGERLYRDRGYLVWLSGGYGGPLGRFGDLLTGRGTYREDVLRDGTWVAVGSAQLGKQDVQPKVIELMRGVEFTRVADLGCGNAHFLITLHQAVGCAGLGVDVSPAACETARAEVARAGLSDRISVVEADAGELGGVPGLDGVQLVVTFFFLHEILMNGYDVLVSYLRELAAALPAGAHVLTAEVTPPPHGAEATDDLFGPEFALVHAIMGQRLLDEPGWRRAFTEAGFEVRETARPTMPDGLVILARKRS